MPPAAAAAKQASPVTAQNFTGNAAPSLGLDPLHSQDLLALHALFDDIAQKQSIGRELVQAKLEAEFGIDSISNMRRRDFYHAMEFLDDLRFDEIRSNR